MATLRDIMQFLCACAAQTGHGFSEDLARELEMQLRKRYPAERIYIPPANSPYDPARTEAMRQAAARLPTGVVAQIFGVSRQAVYKRVRKK